MDWLLKTYPEILKSPAEYIKLAQTEKTWDYSIGLHLWDQIKELAYDKVVNIDCIYSGYGNILTTEDERKQWLIERKIIGVHQIKSDWAATDIPEIPLEPEKPISGKVELFIVTYAKDFPYLRYCLKSIAKFAKGFSGVTILVPTKDAKELRQLVSEYKGEIPVKVKYAYEWAKKGMCWHMAQECRADEWCPDSDYIAHFDSDCIFTSPVTPETFFKSGKPLLRYEAFEALTKRHPGVANWKIAAENALGFKVDLEGMRGHPEIYHRELYAETRRLVEDRQKMAFDDYVKSSRNEYPQSFAEYPTLSAVAIDRFPNLYFMSDCAKQTNPDLSPYPVGQFWSHGHIDHPQDIWWFGEKKSIIPSEKIKEVLGE